MSALAQITDSAWNRRGLLGLGLWATLVPPSLLYGVAARGRNLFYDVGLRRSARVPRPVVSVGNLTVGGTGKTPVVIWLAEALQSKGYRVAVLSRGYRRRGSGVRVVADGGRPLLDVETAGDEPALMGRRLAGIVVVGESRAAAARAAIERGADVLILDDGFQHRSLARDFDLLLVDGRAARSSGWVLPAGPYREPARGARRADAALVMMRSEVTDGSTAGSAEDAPERDTGAARSLAGFGTTAKPAFVATMEPRALVFPKDGAWTEQPLAEIGGRQLLAVSGLANSGRFHSMLAELGGRVGDTLVFADHHRYDRADWQRINSAARRADLVITTEKDLVKLERFPFAQGSLAALRIGADVAEAGRLLDRISRVIEEVRARNEAALS